MDARRLKAIGLALLLVPGVAHAQATTADFATPPLSTNGSTIANQWDNLILGHQGLAAFFEAKVAQGTEPLDVLQGVMLGLRSQSTTRKDWRLITTPDDAVVLEQNTATDASPTWVERFRVNSTGLTSTPAAHVHAAADTTSGAFASARISQASVEQWATQTPTGLRIPQADVSAQLAAGWIPQTGVTQYQNALQFNANQIIAGQIANAQISASSISQHTFLLTSGMGFMVFTGNCPTGSTEVTGARGAKLAGADAAGGDINYPDAAGVLCKSTAVGSGCGAPAAANYTDFIGIPEFALHTHTGPSHSHTTTLSSHSHTGAAHVHTMAHTHTVAIGAHSHDVIRELADSDTSSSSQGHLVGDANESGTLTTITVASGAGVQSGGASTPTTSASSAADTGSGGSGATGTGGSGTFGSNTAGTGATGSEGGTDPSVGPIFTVKLCSVN